MNKIKTIIVSIALILFSLSATSAPFPPPVITDIQEQHRPGQDAPGYVTVKITFESVKPFAVQSSFDGITWETNYYFIHGYRHAIMIYVSTPPGLYYRGVLLPI